MQFMMNKKNTYRGNVPNKQMLALTKHIFYIRTLQTI
jgi:hypothetical protein